MVKIIYFINNLISFVTLFDDPDDDEYDGNFTEDDEDFPRV